MKLAVSACLLGICCKYNGQHNCHLDVLALQENYRLIPICPEQLGGMTTPRLPSEILKERVVNINNQDVTDYFILGARKALEIIKQEEIDIALMKSKSPSCGYEKIYDGTFSKTIINGFGITTRLFLDYGIKVFTEENIEELKKWLLKNKKDNNLS